MGEYTCVVFHLFGHFMQKKGHKPTFAPRHLDVAITAFASCCRYAIRREQIFFEIWLWVRDVAAPIPHRPENRYMDAIFALCVYRMEEDMKLGGICKLLGLGLILVLTACAAPQPETPEEPGVEDINPGERSVITAPGRQSPAQDRLGERNI